MVRSGIVIHLNRAEESGVIRDLRGKEYFFSIHECVENELPKLHSTVTFIKDPDFKSTDVAALIKTSRLFKKAG